jgi:hypothetical protein
LGIISSGFIPDTESPSEGWSIAIVLVGPQTREEFLADDPSFVQPTRPPRKPPKRPSL